MPNIELARKTLEHIKAHPKTWNQDFWHCGTAFCFAGHVAVSQGKGKLTNFSSWVDPEDWTDVEEKGDMPTETIANRAMRLLDIDRGSAAVLFSPENSLEDLENMIDELEETDEIDGINHGVEPAYF